VRAFSPDGAGQICAGHGGKLFDSTHFVADALPLTANPKDLDQSMTYSWVGPISQLGRRRGQRHLDADRRRVWALHARKRREEKPFAVMVADLGRRAPWLT
jgi:hypothetical protein